MERYESLSLTKKRRDAELCEQTGVAELLALPEWKWDTVFSMTDIDSLEGRCTDLEKKCTAVPLKDILGDMNITRDVRYNFQN